MLDIFGKNKKKYEAVAYLYATSVDAHVMGDRKTVVLDHAEQIGYKDSILIYPKASLSEVMLGYSPAHGWVISETVQKPKTRDGYVICTASWTASKANPFSKAGLIIWALFLLSKIQKIKKKSNKYIHLFLLFI